MPEGTPETLMAAVTAAGLAQWLAAAPAGAQGCKRADLAWETWRDHVIGGKPC